MPWLIGCVHNNLIPSNSAANLHGASMGREEEGPEAPGRDVC